jgi:hypothetical protein
MEICIYLNSEKRVKLKKTHQGGGITHRKGMRAVKGSIRPGKERK